MAQQLFTVRYIDDRDLLKAPDFIDKTYAWQQYYSTSDTLEALKEELSAKLSGLGTGTHKVVKLVFERQGGWWDEEAFLKDVVQLSTLGTVTVRLKVVSGDTNATQQHTSWHVRATSCGLSALQSFMHGPTKPEKKAQ